MRALDLLAYCLASEPISTAASRRGFGELSENGTGYGRVRLLLFMRTQ
jgi:hypothetical protein